MIYLYFLCKGIGLGGTEQLLEYFGSLYVLHSLFQFWKVPNIKEEYNITLFENRRRERVVPSGVT